MQSQENCIKLTAILRGIIETKKSFMKVEGMRETPLEHVPIPTLMIHLA